MYECVFVCVSVLGTGDAFCRHPRPNNEIKKRAFIAYFLITGMPQVQSEKKLSMSACVCVCVCVFVYVCVCVCLCVCV